MSFNDLSEKDKRKLSEIMNKLLGQTNIINGDGSSNVEWLFLKNHMNDLNDCFAPLGFKVKLEGNKYAHLVSTDVGDDLKYRPYASFTPTETGVVSVLYGYYINKKISGKAAVTMNYEDFKAYLTKNHTKLINMLKPSIIDNTLKKLYKHKFIEYINGKSITEEDGSIKINYTIESLVNEAFVQENIRKMEDRKAKMIISEKEDENE